MLPPKCASSLPENKKNPRQRALCSIAVTGGKGGVGKTSVAANLAVICADIGKRTLLLDADLGLANIDLILGLQPQYTLADVMNGHCAIEDILLEGPGGVLVVPAASGNSQMGALQPRQHAGLVNLISELEQDVDVMIIDTAPGISDSVLTFCQAAQDTLLVVCDEPAALADAYALIKILVRERGVGRIHVIASRVRDAVDGRMVYVKLLRVCERFLADVALNYLGCVPNDDWLRLSVQRRQPVVKLYPRAPSAQALMEIARRAVQWQRPAQTGNGVEFFLERLIQPRSHL